MLPAVIVAAAGAVLLALLLLRLRAPLHRMVHARSNLRRSFALSLSALRELVAFRRPGEREAGAAVAPPGGRVDSSRT